MNLGCGCNKQFGALGALVSKRLGNKQADAQAVADAWNTAAEGGFVFTGEPAPDPVRQLDWSSWNGVPADGFMRAPEPPVLTIPITGGNVAKNDLLLWGGFAAIAVGLLLAVRPS